MRFILSAFLWLLLSSPLVRAQQDPPRLSSPGAPGSAGSAAIPAPLINFAAAGGLVVTGTVTCFIDSQPRSRDASIADLEMVRHKGFNTPWPRFLDGINSTPRSYAFWMQAGLHNNSDSTLELSMGYGQTDFVDAWMGSQYISGGWLRITPPRATYLQRQSQTLPLRLAPHETVNLIVRLRQFTDNYSFSGLQFYDRATLGAEALKSIRTDNANLIVQMLFQGFLICQLLYVLSQWLIIRRREYLYYLFYITLIWLYFLSKQEQLFGVPVLFTRFPMLRVYIGKSLLILPYFVYFRFVRSFLEIPRDYPRLNRWIIVMERFLLVYALFDFLFMLFTLDSGVQIRLYSIVFAAVFLVTIGFIVYLIRYRQPLIYFILTGSLLVATGHILGLTASYLQYVRHVDLGIPDIFIFPQAGIVLEVLCFTAGLSYKNRKTEMEKITGQERLIEQLKANELLQTRMQHIRNKIAQDLHDDIGSTLSSISILSDLAIRGNSGTQSLETMNEIKDSSLLLMERMDDIVWSINPRNDSLENLLMRVRHFATTLFEAKGIDYTIEIQQHVDEVRLPIEYRQHIYLILKEAINNLVKYAQASEAFIIVSFTQRHLLLCVRDNGCGFDVGGDERGNGITGMQRRAELMNARVTIASAPGGGTTINLQVDLG
jgi:signal transduction histidine kinase